MKKLSEAETACLKQWHSEGRYIKTLARIFGIRTQRVIQICGRKRIEYTHFNEPLIDRDGNVYE